MTGLTGLVAAIGCIFVVFGSPLVGLIAYTFILIGYPYDLTIQLGTVDFTASRIVMMLLFTSLFLRPNTLHSFRMEPIDWCIILFLVCQVVSTTLVSRNLMNTLINRSGMAFDLTLPYFAVRMIIKTKEDYIKYAKLLLAASIPLALLGLQQAITGYSMYSSLSQYAAWGDIGDRQDMRFGFYRANVSFPVHILYGLYFVMAASICAGIFKFLKSNRQLYITGVCVLGIGVFASMSSGPMLGAIVLISFLLFFRFRQFWKPIVGIGVIFCLGVELLSNRHFYDVLGDFTLDSSTAWYRSMLIEVAIFRNGMGGHWLFGYGLEVDPGWGRLIDGRGHTDMVNHFLLILSRFGLVGFVPFLGILFFGVQNLIQAFLKSRTVSVQWMVWCVAGGLVTLLVVFFRVSLFGQPRTVFYMILALCGSMPALVRTANLSAASGVKKRGRVQRVSVRIQTELPVNN